GEGGHSAHQRPNKTVKQPCARILAARLRPSFASMLSLEEKRARGKPGAGRTRSLACRMKKHTSGSHHRFNRAGPGLPRASGFNGFLRALPGVHDVLVTVIGTMQSILANLAPAKGRQDHATSPSVLASFVQRRRYVHRIPRSTSVTMRNAPPIEAGWAA